MTEVASSTLPPEPDDGTWSPRNLFWQTYLRLGFVVLAGESVAVLIYFLISPDESHQSVLILIASLAIAFALASMPMLGTIARKSWREQFSLGVALLSGLALTCSAALSGGIDSPLAYLFALPALDAALALSVPSVTTTAAASIVELSFMAIFDRDTTRTETHVVLLFALVAGSCVLAVVSSVARSRLSKAEVRYQSQLEHLAITDSLTGCLNHRAFFNRLQAEIEHCVRDADQVVLVSGDVDYFKFFNDTHGHRAGDEALQTIGREFRSNTRPSDAVGRIGGDEFAVILPATSIDTARDIAERITKSLQAHSNDGVRLSFGIAALDNAEPTIGRLTREADRALYAAKAAGRGRIELAGVNHREHKGVPSQRQLHPLRGEDRDRFEKRILELDRELSEQDALVSLMFESGPLGICVVDRDYRVLRINGVLAGAVGAVPQSLIGMPLSAVAPEMWPVVRPYNQAVFETGVASTGPQVEGSADPFSGRRHYWQPTFYPMKMDGETVAVATLVMDVSERVELQQSQSKLIDSMGRAISAVVEMHDPYTGGHETRVSQVAMAIATSLHLSDEDIREVGLAAQLHDIGKVRVPAVLLARPGRLTSAEMAIVREHPATGAEMLEAIGFPKAVSEMVRQHHERLDGSGYPRGLVGAEISQGAQIIAVADVVEAMTMTRPYREALGIDAALREIESQSGRLFDAKIVQLCVELFREGFLEFQQDQIQPVLSGTS